jgi:hypothetical protein
MPDLAVEKHIATKALHKLIDSDLDLARSTVDHLNRFDMRIELFPLAAQVGTNLFFPDYTPASRCLGPLPPPRRLLLLIPATRVLYIDWNGPDLRLRIMRTPGYVPAL